MLTELGGNPHDPVLGKPSDFVDASPTESIPDGDAATFDVEGTEMTVRLTKAATG